MLDFILDGLKAMHDDAARREFLLEFGGRLQRLPAWLRSSGLSGQVDETYTPTFLHGGTSAGRWVVMGINPGADAEHMEHVFKRASPENFVRFHEEFFGVFPGLRRTGSQRWWTKLYRVTRLLDGVVAPRLKVDWPALQKSSNFVVQDLIPFHGARSRMLGRLSSGSLSRIIEGTWEGVVRSRAKGILVFSRPGFELVKAEIPAKNRRSFSLSGRNKGGPVCSEGLIGRMGSVPVLAVDNEYVAQPTVPYEQSLPQLLSVVRAEGMLTVSTK